VGVVPETVAVKVTESPSIIEAEEGVTVVVVFVLTNAFPTAEAVRASTEGQRPNTNAVPDFQNVFALTTAGTRQATMKSARKMAKECFCEGRLAMRSPVT
jgi:hypothetical protein